MLITAHIAKNIIMKHCYFWHYKDLKFWLGGVQAGFLVQSLLSWKRPDSIEEQK